MLNASEQLGQNGSLARHVEYFSPRIQQQEMAQAVEQAIADSSLLISEAGTGTGKTFAYLVPALQSGKKIIISTGTRNLQDQLFHKDLPVVARALGLSVRTALLKGRANYLCHHRLEMTHQKGRFKTREMANHFMNIRQWAELTQSGDIAELTSIPEDTLIWPDITSTADNCLGQECGYYSKCFVMKARKEAQEADIVVINHHLLFADMTLREEGFGEILPETNAFILDEAHQLAEVASNFFGTVLGSRQLLELADDIIAERIKDAGDMTLLDDAANQMKKTVLDFRLAFGKEIKRGVWSKIAGKVNEALTDLLSALGQLKSQLEPAAQRGKGLDNCYRRSGELLHRLIMVTESPADNQVQWYETFSRAFALHLTPTDIGTLFVEHMNARKCAWLFTSATLAIGDSFEHFASQLGINEAITRKWGSPFDYQTQSLLYVPSGLPDPNEPMYTEAMLEAAIPVVEASQGRTFILFTSHRALKMAASMLESRLEFPLLVQGSAPRDDLLEKFRQSGNAVLLGTSSFWQGVDVRGQALSCVIIDKLPFAHPDDPVLQARIDTMRKHSGNPFMEYQLPNAVIILKQGVGRLIRDINDRGVMMICDPRIINKSYGKIFLNSLPEMPLTRRLDDVEIFFAEENEPALLQENHLMKY